MQDAVVATTKQLTYIGIIKPSKVYARSLDWTFMGAPAVKNQLDLQVKSPKYVPLTRSQRS